MTTRTAETSPLVYARVAGFLYLIIIITSVLGMILINNKLVVPGDAATTFNNIMADELLFRIGVAYEIIMLASVLLLSWILYVIVKTVNKNLALLALLWRFGEVIIGNLAVLSSLIVLLLINGKDYSAVFETEQLQALVGLFLDESLAARSILFVFMSLGSIVFYYLFFKSKYIPRILAAFGVFSYSLALIGVFVSIILSIDFVDTQMIFGVPVFLFEVMIGFWLLFKGINVEEWEKRALESRVSSE